MKKYLDPVEDAPKSALKGTSSVPPPNSNTASESLPHV